MFVWNTTLQGFGANLPLLILPYVVDWVVGPEAAINLIGSPGMLFAACVVLHMLVRLPVTFVWKWAAGRFGKYQTFLAYNILYGSYMFVFLAVTKGQALLAVILSALWGIAYGGHWLLMDLASDVIESWLDMSIVLARLNDYHFGTKAQWLAQNDPN